jgi:ribosomal protein S18 acetylase RimI-like enzyme
MTNEPSSDIPQNITIVEANLADQNQVETIIDVLDSYAREPAGGSAAIPADVRERLLTDLHRVDNALVLTALDADGRTVGIAVCFRGYSTFKARPLINIHDLAVLPDQRGRGVGSALIEAVEERGRALGCCKITLEVLDDNHGARRLYESVGFADGGPGEGDTNTMFLQKPLL